MLIDGRQLSLFFADVLQAIGAAMDARWVQAGFVQIGGYCTAQGAVRCCQMHVPSWARDLGAIQQLGETSAAIATMVHAFLSFRGRAAADT